MPTTVHAQPPQRNLCAFKNQQSKNEMGGSCDPLGAAESATYGSALCQAFVLAQAYGIRHRGGVLNFAAEG